MKLPSVVYSRLESGKQQKCEQIFQLGRSMKKAAWVGRGEGRWAAGEGLESLHGLKGRDGWRVWEWGEKPGFCTPEGQETLTAWLSAPPAPAACPGALLFPSPLSCSLLEAGRCWKTLLETPGCLLAQAQGIRLGAVHWSPGLPLLSLSGVCVCPAMGCVQLHPHQGAPGDITSQAVPKFPTKLVPRVPSALETCGLLSFA